MVKSPDASYQFARTMTGKKNFFPFLKFDYFGKMRNVITLGKRGTCSSMKFYEAKLQALWSCFWIWGQEPKIKSNAFLISCKNTFHEGFLIVKTTRSRPLLLLLLNHPFWRVLCSNTPINLLEREIGWMLKHSTGLYIIQKWSYTKMCLIPV